MSLRSSYRFVPAAIWLAGLTIAAPQSTPDLDQSSKAKKASIRGRVVDLAGSPIAKARVSAEVGTDEVGQKTRSYVLGTGPEGKFTFEGLNAGSYRITVERTGYLGKVFERWNAGANGTWMTLTSGQEISDIVVRLTPEATLAGRVLDEDHDPVTNVSVRLFSYEYQLGMRRTEPMALGETDSSGAFRVTGISPGRYYLVVMPRKTLVESSALPTGRKIQLVNIPTYYGGSAEASSAQQIAITAGETAAVGDLILRKAPIVHIRGRVKQEAPSAAATGRIAVHAVPEDSRSAIGPFDAPTAVVSPKDGTFDIVDASPGRYTLVITNTIGGARILGRESLVVGDTDLEDVVLSLQTGEVVGGLVYASPRSEPSTSPGKVPEVKASTALPYVVLLPEGPAAFSNPSQPMKDGSFLFRDLGPGLYRIRVTRLPPDVYLKSIRSADGEDLLNADMDLTHGGRRAVTVTLSLAPARLEGTVVDDDGKPLDGIIVTSAPKSLDARQAHRYLKTSSDENGHFTMGGLAPGEYCLYTWKELAEGEEFDEGALQRESQRCTRVELQENGTQSVQLKFSPAKAPGQ